MGCVGSAICVGSTLVGTSVGGSVGGIAVFVGNGCGVLVGRDASVGVLVGMLVGVLVGGIPVIVDIGVIVGMDDDDAVLSPLTEGFVPQSTSALRHFVTRACKAAGSQALKKS